MFVSYYAPIALNNLELHWQNYCYLETIHAKKEIQGLLDIFRLSDSNIDTDTCVQDTWLLWYQKRQLNEYAAKWYATNDAQCKQLLGPLYYFDMTVNDCVHD